MNRFVTNHRPLTIFLVFFAFLCFPLESSADSSIITKYIVKYNLKALDQSIADGSYRGEEGILRIKPEIADSLGIKVFIDQDYIDSIRLFERAEKSLDAAKSAMSSRKNGETEKEKIKTIVDSSFIYKESSELAKVKLLAYHSRINPEIDERLDEETCYNVMGDLLEKSFRETDFRLRDALGHFSNVCQGVNDIQFPVTHENVGFVNFVFNGFLEEASVDDLKGFDLDLHHSNKNNTSTSDWSKVIEKKVLGFISYVETSLKKNNAVYEIDPLLFIALLKKESSFNPNAVSYVGAAGLTQIMPKTAKDMGMNNIHEPSYLESALDTLKRERRAEKQAMDTFLKIDKESGVQYAKEARRLMQRSKELGKERKRLFKKYRNELLKNRNDDRLQPELAIDYGVKYFAKLMKRQGGDISLALASYNAGPSRIIQYKGIPPFEETVTFRNKILMYYREYLQKVEKM